MEAWNPEPAQCVPGTTELWECEREGTELSKGPITEDHLIGANILELRYS